MGWRWLLASLMSMYLRQCAVSMFFNGQETLCIVEGPCTVTERPHRVVLKLAEYERLMRGERVQDVVPQWPQMEREFLISGLTEEGHQQMMQSLRATAPVQTAKPVIAQVKQPSRIFLDVESQKSAQEVGGWKPELMLFGLAVTHDDVHGYQTWYEKDIAALVDLLLSSDQVVGYNLIDFDLRLIAAYDRRIAQVTSKAVDLLTQISSALGFRLKLDDVARATLGRGKTGDGMLSLSLWKQGRFAEVEAYCKMDVELTKELHAHALQHGKLRYPSYGQIRDVAIDLRPVV